MSKPTSFSTRSASSSSSYYTRNTKSTLTELKPEKYLGYKCQISEARIKQEPSYSSTQPIAHTINNGLENIPKPHYSSTRILESVSQSNNETHSLIQFESDGQKISEWSSENKMKRTDDMEKLNNIPLSDTFLESQVEELTIQNRKEDETNIETEILEEKNSSFKQPEESNHYNSETSNTFDNMEAKLVTINDKKLVSIKSELNEVRQRIADISSFTGCSDTTKFIKGTLFLIDIWPEQRDTLRHLSLKIKRGSMGFSPVIAQALLEKLLTYYISYSIYNTGAYISEIVKHDGTILPRWRFQQKNQELPFEERQKICQVVRELERERKTEKVKLIIVDRLYTVYTKIHGDDDADEVRDQLWEIVDQAVEVSLDMWSQPMPVKSVKATEDVYKSEDYAGIPAGSEPGPNTIQLEIYPSFKTHNSFGEEYVLLKGKLLYLQ
ncbi:hypothetical protein J3Q64DRAFT_1772446 [Phycomyces blakesleeanus]|uniref:Uncharacterized protein n=2 Tax=Phycomyces blakesleeanus TaxID=4837 RepID=A0A167M3E9_PHYB8|nr:hypothetical protein PHYBLDRAFT_69996 [Phycomyces blakesleeanus NRRL 1555(-)]OAD71664.1 hypothetical protein PHYBLDRAFT_69996 [Phycomyces blakesleeanus NRRL 1555(-)]|eukprot:XP_018289704.1 hypothetical protein PHYBLDRAFT_69996 [Phycomyces blakesleeanus NRRL 1555(-)]